MFLAKIKQKDIDCGSEFYGQLTKTWIFVQGQVVRRFKIATPVSYASNVYLKIDIYPLLSQ